MPDIVPEAVLVDELAISCWLLTACIGAAASRQPRKWRLLLAEHTLLTAAAAVVGAAERPYVDPTVDRALE